MAQRNVILIGVIAPIVIASVPAGMEAPAAAARGIRRAAGAARSSPASASPAASAFQFRARRLAVSRRPGEVPQRAQRHRAHVQHLRMGRLPDVGRVAAAEDLRRRPRAQRERLPGLHGESPSTTATRSRCSTNTACRCCCSRASNTGAARSTCWAPRSADPNQTKWKLVLPGQDRDDLHAPSAARRTAAQSREKSSPVSKRSARTTCCTNRASRVARSASPISTLRWAIPIAPPRGAPPTIRSSTEPSMPPRPANPKPATPPAAATTPLAPSAPARADRDPVPHLVQR